MSAGGGPDGDDSTGTGERSSAAAESTTATEAAWAAVDEFDRSVAEWCEGVHTPALDRFFYSLSTAADHSALWFALGALEALRRDTPSLAIRLGVAIGIESGLTNGVIKSAFGRVRPPSHLFHPRDEPLPYGMRRPITSSFPSGHATAAFTAAVLLSTSSRNRPAWFALAGLVAASRVYVRMHHASDVIAGAGLGLALGAVLRRALRVP